MAIKKSNTTLVKMIDSVIYAPTKSVNSLLDTKYRINKTLWNRYLKAYKTFMELMNQVLEERVEVNPVVSESDEND